ncbi:hypothetical protein ACPV5O_05190 [Vibrio maritimus]
MGDEKDPMYNDYEGSDKIWSMKTDGTDLRLVTDELPTKFAHGSGKMVRSPDMRYLAYSYNGSSKAVYDLKTGRTHDLDANGGYGFLWAEDSSYLYYMKRDRHQLVTYKWDVVTKSSTKVGINISDTGVVTGGKRVVVNVAGVGVDDEKSNKSLQGISWLKKLGLDQRDESEWWAEYRSIDPMGKVAWAESSKHTFFVDVTTDTVEIREQYMPYIVGLHGRYTTGVRHAMVMDVRDTEKLVAWKWRPLSGRRTLEQSSLYNAFSNEGLWFKEFY